MKKAKLFLYLVPALIAGCSQENPLSEEQYYKQVYLVGADETTNMGMSVVEIPYNDAEEQETFISVATGGSLNIDHDFSVTVDEAGFTSIADYNFKYLKDDDVQYQHLEEAFYRIPHNEITLKAGEVYARMPLYLKSSELHCDSLYALTFKISEVSDPDDLSIRQTDTVLIQSYIFVNEYSDTYQMEGYYYRWAEGQAVGDSTSVTATRSFKAVNANTVRLFHLAYTESQDNIGPYGLTLKVNDDNSLTIKSWDQLEITDGGGNWSPQTGIFNVWYNYEADGTTFQFAGSFVKSDS